MRIDREKLKRMCETRHISVAGMLAASKVSRTAFYSLLRKENVLPKSIDKIAGYLDVPASAMLVAGAGRLWHMRALQARAVRICKDHRGCDRDVVFRTLLNLDLPPAERLRRALVRGRGKHIH